MSDSDVDFSHHKETDTWRYVCRECEHDSGFRWWNLEEATVAYNKHRSEKHGG